MQTGGFKMLEEVLSRANLNQAWKKVKANGGAPGADGVSIEDFTEFAREHWPGIKQKILEGTYQPAPVKRVEIPKPNGRGKRNLGIPTILDRVLCQAILQVLQPIFDPQFSNSSHGFRPGRSCHGAVKQARRIIEEGYGYALDLDLEKFFDTVSQDILMYRLAREIEDKRVLRLIGRFLRSGVEVDGKILPTTQGVIQGSPLSPLLANIVLDAFDKEMEARGHRFVRYADDAVIFVKSKRAAERVMESVVRYLKLKLKLRVNQQKSQIAKSNECEYLGFTFPGKRIVWTDNSLAEFKHTIRRLTARSWGVSMEYRLERLSKYIRGWMAYYALSQYYSPIPILDEWIRRRVRMCYIKQWRRCRTRIRNLINLGSPRHQAIGVGLSSKGYWRLARTFGTQCGLSNAYLKEQGLLSVKDLWCAYHYPVP